MANVMVAGRNKVALAVTGHCAAAVPMLSHLFYDSFLLIFPKPISGHVRTRNMDQYEEPRSGDEELQHDFWAARTPSPKLRISYRELCCIDPRTLIFHLLFP